MTTNKKSPPGNNPRRASFLSESDSYSLSAGASASSSASCLIPIASMVSAGGVSTYSFKFSLVHHAFFASSNTASIIVAISFSVNSSFSTAGIL